MNDHGWIDEMMTVKGGTKGIRGMESAVKG